MKETDYSNFIKDLNKINAQIREETIAGTIKPGFDCNKSSIISLLNKALATEIICAHRYKSHYFASANLGEQLIADEFLEHANEEQAHADQLAKRIDQLGGQPIYDPIKISQLSHSEYKLCDTINEMLLENLAAERIAVTSYRAMINFVGSKDPVTRTILENILIKEEEHLDDIYNFLNKNTILRNSKISQLKKVAEALAKKMLSEEEKNGKPVTTFKQDIASIVEELNNLDEEHKHKVSDFLPEV